MFRKLSIVVLSLAFIAPQALPLSVNAATQTQSVGLTPVLADSDLVSNANLGIYLEPASATQTQVTPENETHMYGWTFNPYSHLPCEQASPLTFKLRATSSLDTEGGQSWSVLYLAKYSGSAATPLNPQTPVIEGYSPEDTPILVGRWSPGTEGIPVEEATGTAGVLEAVWDISGLSSSEQVGVAINNRADEGTTGLLTTIEYAQVSYDTTACSITASPPETGIVTGLVVGISAALAALFLILRTAKKLKARH